MVGSHARACARRLARGGAAATREFPDRKRYIRARGRRAREEGAGSEGESETELFVTRGN